MRNDNIEMLQDTLRILKQGNHPGRERKLKDFSIFEVNGSVSVGRKILLLNEKGN